jgi:hypothetical protein
MGINNKLNASGRKTSELGLIMRMDANTVLPAPRVYYVSMTACDS